MAGIEKDRNGKPLKEGDYVLVDWGQMIGQIKSIEICKMVKTNENMITPLNTRCTLYSDSEYLLTKVKKESLVKLVGELRS